MNKQLKFLMVAAVAAVSIASCKKNEVVEPEVSNTTCKVAQVDYTYNGTSDGTLKFTYDASGKLISYAEDGVVVPYTYNGDKITISPKYDAYSVSVSNGKIIKQEYTGSNSFVNYTYDKDGYLTMTQWYEGSVLKGTSVFTYNNNNLVKVVETRTDGFIYTTTNEFSTETASNNSMFVDPLGNIEDYLFPGSYYGNLSKNLLVKSTRVSSSQQVTNSNVETYTYTKDSSNKVTSKTVSRTSTAYTNGVIAGTPSTSTEKFSITYMCN